MEGDGIQRKQGKKAMGDLVQKMVARFQPGSLTPPVSHGSPPRVSSGSSSTGSGSETPLLPRRRRPFVDLEMQALAGAKDGGYDDDCAGGRGNDGPVEKGAGGHGGDNLVENGAGGRGGADLVENGAGGRGGADRVENGAGGRGGADRVENGAGGRGGADRVENGVGGRRDEDPVAAAGNDREAGRNAQQVVEELTAKLKALASKVKIVFSKLCCCTGQGVIPLPRPRPSAPSADVKEWRDSVEKALANHITLSRLLYFGMMTMGLTILFARRRDTTATGLDKAAMGVEMGVIFSTISLSLHKIMCEHTVQTSAPRVAKCYEQTNALLLWLFTISWMLIYTTRIPHELFCWWMWVIFGFAFGVVSITTVSVGCMGRATEERMIYWEELAPVANHEE